MSISVANAPPSEYALPTVASSSKAVLRRRQTWFNPLGGNTYAPSGAQGQDIIEFEVASLSEIALMSQSYMRFILQITPNLNIGVDSAAQTLLSADYYNFADGTTAADVNARNLRAFGARLSKVGVHALFENVEIHSVQTGGQIQISRNYPMQTALAMKLFMSSSDLGTMYPELVGCEELMSGSGTTVIPIESVVGLSSVVGAPNTIAVDDLSLHGYSKMQVGDILMATQCLPNAADIDHGTFFVRIIGLTTEGVQRRIIIQSLNSGTFAANSNLVVPKYSAALDEAARQYNCILFRPSNNILSKRILGANSKGIVVTFQPQMSVWTHNVPLFLIKNGLRFSFRLAPAARVFNFPPIFDGATPTLPETLSYTIKSPKLMIMMSAPHQELVDSYLTVWRSDEGLLYPIPNWHWQAVVQSDVTNGSTYSVTFAPGVRSARQVYVVLTDDQYTARSGKVAFANDSNCTFLRSGTSRYKFMVGTENYPTREIRLDDACIGPQNELMQQLKLCTGRTDMTGIGAGLEDRCVFYNGNDNNADCFSRLDADSFIMCADLSRSKGPNSHLTGLDITLVNLTFESTKLNHSTLGHPGKVVVNLFVRHDMYWKINRNGQGVLV